MKKYLEWTIVLVIIWYISSTGFSLFLQDYLNSVKANANNIDIYSIICLAVFIQNLSCWLGISILYLVFIVRNREHSDSSIRQRLTDDFTKLKKIKKLPILFVFAGLFHSMGTLIMNYMLTLSNIPCVHTIRALEPLLASFLVCFIRMPSKKKHTSEETKTDDIEKWVGTILILFGALLATWRSGQCDLLNTIIFLGLFTNLIMVFRNICIQHVSAENNELFTQFILYAVSTLVSFLLLMANDFPDSILKKYATLLCLTGLCSFIYNTASIVVCGRVTLVSHSLLTMLKRPTLIVASSIYFNHSVTLAMLIGNIIIVIGITLYKINVIFLLSISRKVLYLSVSILLIVFCLIVTSPFPYLANMQSLLTLKNVTMNN